MTVAGKDITLKVPGAALSLTAEATTEVSTTVFQITDAAKRILDHSATITVLSSATPITSGYTLNRLTGTVTFDSSRTGETITITGSYLPVVSAATASAFKISLKKTNGDKTTLGSAWTQRQSLLKDVSGSVTRFDEADNYYMTLITDDEPVVLELSIAGTAHCRIWGIVASDDLDGAADGFVEGSLEFEGNADADGNAIAFL